MSRSPTRPRVEDPFAMSTPVKQEEEAPDPVWGWILTHPSTEGRSLSASLPMWPGVGDSKVLERSDLTCRRGTPFVRKSLRDGAFASMAE